MKLLLSTCLLLHLHSWRILQSSLLRRPAAFSKSNIQARPGQQRDRYRLDRPSVASLLASDAQSQPSTLADANDANDGRQKDGARPLFFFNFQLRRRFASPSPAERRLPRPDQWRPPTLRTGTVRTAKKTTIPSTSAQSPRATRSIRVSPASASVCGRNIAAATATAIATATRRDRSHAAPTCLVFTFDLSHRAPALLQLQPQSTR